MYWIAARVAGLLRGLAMKRLIVACTVVITVLSFAYIYMTRQRFQQLPVSNPVTSSATMMGSARIIKHQSQTLPALETEYRSYAPDMLLEPDSGHLAQTQGTRLAPVPGLRSQKQGMLIGPDPVPNFTAKDALHNRSLQWALSAGFDFPVIPRQALTGSDVMNVPFPYKPITMIKYRGKKFDVRNKKHVIVLLHIQKTAGTTLNRMLTGRVISPAPCSCRKAANFNGVKLDRVDWRHCRCYHPGQQRTQWLVSRTTTGWRCGLHPGFTDLTECLANGSLSLWDQANPRGWSFFFTTILRRPLDRYVSELAHVKRGGTWKNTTFLCNGVKLRKSQMPLCFKGVNWQDTTVAEFTSCPHNMANNRQTRMLANLSHTNCYWADSMPQADYNRRLLESAKKSLASFAWFGITEFMNESLELFEDRFEMTLSRKPLFFSGAGQKSKSAWLWEKMTPEEIKMVRNANLLDLQLYDYAKALFLKRYGKLKAKLKLTQLADKPIENSIFYSGS